MGLQLDLLVEKFFGLLADLPNLDELEAPPVMKHSQEVPVP